MENGLSIVKRAIIVAIPWKDDGPKRIPDFGLLPQPKFPRPVAKRQQIDELRVVMNFVVLENPTSAGSSPQRDPRFANRNVTNPDLKYGERRPQGARPKRSALVKNPPNSDPAFESKVPSNPSKISNSIS